MVEDSDEPLTQLVIPPPSFPQSLQFLHLNVCSLVNWQGSIGNPLCPRIISWLAHLHGSLSLTTFQCKMFTNDVRLTRKIISLVEETFQTLRLFYIGTYVLAKPLTFVLAHDHNRNSCRGTLCIPRTPEEPAKAGHIVHRI